MDSYVSIAPGHTSFVGEDATRLFAAASLRSAIKLYLKCGVKASRMYTPTNMLAAASRITGKTYKRGQLQAAHDDLHQWVEAMKAAIPVIEEN